MVGIFQCAKMLIGAGARGVESGKLVIEALEAMREISIPGPQIRHW